MLNTCESQYNYHFPETNNYEFFVLTWTKLFGLCLLFFPEFLLYRNNIKRASFYIISTIERDDIRLKICTDLAPRLVRTEKDNFRFARK